MKLAKKLRDMHALAHKDCDPTFNKALLDSAKAISKMERALIEIEHHSTDKNAAATARAALSE